MQTSIFTPLSGALAQERTLEIIANNLANAQTNGFKAEKITFNNNSKVPAYFEFKNLPVKLMSESTLVGNSAVAINQTEYQFQYDYKGIEALAKFDFYLVRNFNSRISYSYLVNNSAPDEINKGSDFFFSQDIYNTKKMSVALHYDYFKIDSDASIAVYSDNNLQTNRVGYLAGFEFKLKQLLSVTIRSGERDVLVENGFQIRERNIVLKLETINVEI